MFYAISGIENFSFKGSRGDTVTGSKIYFEEPIAADRGHGKRSFSAFITAQRLDALPREPQVGDLVALLYNRFGKVQEIRLRTDGEEGMIDY